MSTRQLEQEHESAPAGEGGDGPLQHEPQVAPMLAPEMGPDEVADLVRMLPASRELIVQGVADLHGNAFVAEVMELLDERPPGVEPDPGDRSWIVRQLLVTRHLPDDARIAAEAFNRGHIPNVVRFDRGTYGGYAKINGELDADGVALWQVEHGLEPTGCADDDTIAMLPKAPPRGGPGPGPSPSVDPVPGVLDTLPEELAKILADLERGGAPSC